MDRTPGRVVVFKVLKSRKGCIDQYAIWWVAEYGSTGSSPDSDSRTPWRFVTYR